MTGAGSRGPGVGNGKAASVLFAREGAKVLLVDIDVDHAQETLDMIAGEGGVASVFQADVTKKEDCQAMAAAAVERYGRLDILDNNVGVLLRDKLTDIDPGRLGPRDGHKPEEHDARIPGRGAAHDRVGRRFHHQHIVGGRHEGVERRRLRHFEGGHLSA